MQGRHLILLVAAVLAQAEPASEQAPDLPRAVQAMQRAEAGLRQGLTGAEVQAHQRLALQALEAFVQAAQAHREWASSPPRRRPGRPEQTRPAGTPGAPVKPAEESVPTEGQTRFGPLGERPQGAGQWLPALPERERQAVEDAFRTGRLPARYLELLRLYNLRLARQGAGQPAGGQ